MQLSCGQLLAAGLDGGNTLIFITPSGMKMQSNPSSPTKQKLSPNGLGLFVF
jgi:hypothetical protein